MAPWTIAHQAALSMEFSRQEYWSELPFPTPGDLPNPGTETMSLASASRGKNLAGRFFIRCAIWEAYVHHATILQSLASLVAQMVKNPPAIQETQVRSLG